MNCTNKNHHISNDEPCNSNTEDTCCNSQGHNPHDMHWHINKQSFKGWGLNLVYFTFHIVQIYIIATKL
jgi:hypothetical protein